MANPKHINTHLNINPNMQVSFVAAEDIKKYRAQGYRTMMVKFPSEVDIPELTGQERRALRILMAGKTIKQIADIMSISERAVEKLIANVRAKFDCLSNTELVLKVEVSGISMLLP